MRRTLIISAVLLAACSAGRVVTHSEPMGDFVADTRNPQDVCTEMQQREGNDVAGCELTAAATSQDETVCVDGKSVAGCFVCTFRCR